ncbi:TetR family transcriptional regulator [Blastococcus sp. TF02A-26]|uniref:TetR family transcriptional regulator n=1 Tax=Blastococcus sp. TF02A-26 TaxID=2250577 RepID=UPI000DEAAE4D|nr:TetR family transcriptional regulator [Blastococcus sp. TF02A-26]RBY88769.1 TetR/AcrR family transcriptional regulator [Blastococcus sp. TF02A-26]
MTSTGPASAPAAPARSAGAQRVLDAALELFTAHGFEGTSLQDIADRLGVTKAAVYYHFHTKDELLRALVEPAFAEVSALVAEGEERPASSRRAGVVEVGRYVDYLLRHRRFAVWLARDAAAMTRDVVVQQATEIRERTEAMLVGADADALSRIWAAATLQALAGGLIAAPADAPDEWLREELTELGAHLLAGYRKAARRREA